MSTAQDLPVPYGEPPAGPALRLVPENPLDFADAVRRVRPRLHRYAVRRLGDLHEAEELVQEALLRAYSHRAQLLTEDDLAAWATVVTGRLVIDRLRVRGRSTSVADVPESARIGRDTADVVVARDEARLALDALDAMPTRQAALLWAREVEGRSYDELCERFGMTEPAVRSVLTRARKALRREYTARGGTLPVGGLAVLAPWVAGLTWVGRLRRAAVRAGTPAALSAIGITALGGLVLSPFGRSPGGDSWTFQPTHAVVSTTLTGSAPVSSSPLTSTWSFVPAADRTATSPPASTIDRINRLSQTCINDTNSKDGGAPVVVGTSPSGKASAGGTRCDRARSVRRNTIYLTPVLPDNPTGIRQVGVSSDFVNCSATPNTPVSKCDSTTQQGALK